MTDRVDASLRRARPRRGLRTLVAAGTVAVILAAIAFDTTVVAIGSEQDARVQAFSPETFGETEFPRIQGLIEERAVGAPELAQAIAADPAKAATDHGVVSNGTPVFAVNLTGVAGEARSGVYDVAVEGLEGIRVRVQTGPAINGTDVRDATGTIEFGQFRNQIEYQDAGSALNNQVKSQVLAGIDTANLSGKTLTLTGVFRLVNPESWLVTPVRMSVE
jgi:predicted lipoprotein